MKLDHRPFHPDDARRVCAFFQSAEELFFFLPKAAFPLAPKVLTAAIAQSLAPTSAMTGDRVAGYVDLMEVTQKRHCTIGRLAVDPAFRRQGTASYLVQTIIDLAVAQHQVKFVRASCFSHNTAAYRLLHGMGFRPDDMTPRKTAAGESALLVNMILRCRGGSK